MTEPISQGAETPKKTLVRAKVFNRVCVMHIHDEQCFVVHTQHLTLVPMVVVFLLKSTRPQFLSGHNFLAPHPGLPWAPWAPFLFLWYYPDISDSLLKSESNKLGPPDKGGTSKRGALTKEKG